jgi:hypothetical protein
MVLVPEQRLRQSLRLLLADLPFGAVIPDSEESRRAKEFSQHHGAIAAANQLMENC